VLVLSGGYQKKLKDRRLSSLDVYKLAQEYKNIIVGTHVANVYQYGRNIIFKLRGKEIRRRFLVFEPGVRVNLSNKIHEWKYTNIVQAFRRHLKNRKIVSVYQHAFDRIMSIRFHGGYEAICEMMPRGFLVLIQNGKILVADRYDTMRDRAILPKKEYQFPPNPPRNVLKMSFDEFRSLIYNAKTIFNGLQKLGFGPKYALEICERLGIDKNLDVADISLDEIKHLFDYAINFVNEIMSSIEAYVYFKNGVPCFFAPTKLIIGEGLEFKKFEYFDDALDFYFEETCRSEIMGVGGIDDVKRMTEHKKKLMKIMEHQQEMIKSLNEKIEKMKELVNVIYENYADIEKVLKAIRKAKDELDLDWDEIRSRIKKAKMQGIKDVQIIDEIRNDGTVILKIGQHRVSTNFRESINDIARRIYERIKKMEEKVKGAILALNETKKKIKDVDQKLKAMVMEEKVSLFEPERRWYHGFRWFFTTNGFLVVAGRDAQTNEVLLRKYMEKDDIVLHAEIPGGAVVLIKDAKNRVKKEDIMEAAIYAASYSKAWDVGLGATDVFMTFPEHISFSPPSGMYLRKGAFMVKKKELIRNVSLEVAIGIKVYEKNSALGVAIISCPRENAMMQTDKYILIRPGKKDKNEIAREIRKILIEWLLENRLKKRNRRLAEKIIQIEKIVDLVPGPAEIVVDGNARNNKD